MRRLAQLLALMVFAHIGVTVDAQPSAPPLTPEQLDRLHAVKAWDIEFTYHYTEIQNGGGDVTTSYAQRPVDHWSVSHNHDKQFVIKLTVAGQYGQSDCAHGSDLCIAKYQYPATVSGIQESFSRLDEIHFSDFCTVPPDTTTGPGFQNSHQTWTVSGTKNLDGTGHNVALVLFELNYGVNPPTVLGEVRPYALDYDITIDHAGCVMNDHTTFTYSSDFYIGELYPYVPGDKQVRIENGSFVIHGSGTETQTLGVASGWVNAFQNGGGQRTWFREWTIREHPDSSIIITRPAHDMLFVSSETEEIRWVTDLVDSVRIFYSVDSGMTYSMIADSVPASAARYTWTVPDTLLSKKCRIVIQDANNISRTDTSDIFKIKGYILARDSADQWEPFRFAEDRWSFGNSAVNKWPPGWWSQFNYQNGLDPFVATPQNYPQSISKPFRTANSFDFPDWPTFVRAFGTSQCYTYLSQIFGGFYRPSALAKWASAKAAWNGSCFGFSISSLLAFDDSAVYRSLYPTMPSFDSLHSLPIDTNIRKIINELFTHQFGGQHQRFRNTVINNTPSQTVQQIKQMFLSDVQDHRSIGFLNNGPGGGGHSVVPYKAVKDTTIPGYWIYVYDNAYHNIDTARFRVDTVSNGGMGTWTNNLWPGWGGTQGFYLRDPASTYRSGPTLTGIPSKQLLAVSAEGTEVSPTLDASIMITNSAGDSLGYSDSLIVNKFPGAFPFVPETGSLTPPYSYDLPPGSVNIRMNRFADSVSRLSIFTDTMIFVYERSNADPSQSDLFSYDGNFSVKNVDAQSKTIAVQAIMINGTVSEKVYSIENCTVSQNDSLRFDRENQDQLKVINSGGSTSYNLSIEYATSTGSSEFRHSGITLESNSSHLIDPNWNDLGVPVRIYIDRGNDGTIDDSLDIVTAVHEDERGYSGIPDKFALAQNYPNPFNPKTNFELRIANFGFVSLKVYDVLGREVATLVNEMKMPGEYTIAWNAANMPSGVYFYRMIAGNFIETKKLLLLR